MSEKPKGNGSSTPPAAKPADPSGTPPEEGMTKIEAVRRAVEALGPRAHRQDIQEYIQKEFGVEMTVDRISTVKAEVLRKAKAKKKPGRPAGAKAKAVPAATTAEPTAPAAPAAVLAAPASNGKPGVLLVEDVEALKSMLGRFGPDRLLTLIDMLNK